jgi:hypothetical protein
MAMSTSEERDDDRLRRALQALPVPETPAEVASRVNDRLWQRRRLQRAGTAGVVALLLLAVVFVAPWGRKDEPVVPLPLPIAQVPHEIPARDLEVLFAPPPVDSLAVLDRRNAASVAALNRLEGVK